LENYFGGKATDSPFNLMRNYQKLTWKSTTYISSFLVILEPLLVLVLCVRSGARADGPPTTPAAARLSFLPQFKLAHERFIPANLYTIEWDSK
jgi:hypothetical protein